MKDLALVDVIEELVEERGLDRQVLSTVISEGLLAAYARKYPDLDLKIEHDKKTNDFVVLIEKEVVSSVDDDEKQIGLKKARAIDKNAEIGSRLWVPFSGVIGRIEILKARQVIASKIRKIEADAIYREFKDREGDIVVGVIHKIERNGVVILLGDTYALLPRSLSIPGEKYVVGFSIRALLKEVLAEPQNDYQLILDRSSDRFVAKLLELEIPEVFERLIEIKKIVRIPGYKTKILVASNDLNIDPVGTCIGVGGSRIKPILKELGTEKIDIIGWSNNIETLVKNALKPAQVDGVEMVNDSTAKVMLGDDQRSIAIGRMGQNIVLASRLTNIDIQLTPERGDSNSMSEPIELDSE